MFIQFAPAMTSSSCRLHMRASNTTWCEAEIKYIQQWTDENNLKLNTSKSKQMIDFPSTGYSWPISPTSTAMVEKLKKNFWGGAMPSPQTPASFPLHKSQRSFQHACLVASAYTQQQIFQQATVHSDFFEFICAIQITLMYVCMCTGV